MKSIAIAVLALAGAGCLNITPSDGALHCSTVGNQCPGGYYCAADKTCWHTGKGPAVAGMDMAMPGGGGSGGGGGGGSGGGPDDMAQPIIGCMVPSDCPAPSMPCLLSACIAGTCALVSAPAGTDVPAAMQTPNDCKKLVCDTNGKPMPVADTTDLPVDATGGCQTPSCNGPTPTFTPTTSGTACTQQANGICNGGGICGVCKPGTTQCVGATLARNLCSAQGQWAPTTSCPNQCTAGLCTGACNSGTDMPYCANTTTLETCVSANWSATNCNGGGTTVCYNNRCTGTCQPAPNACNSAANAIVGCDASGTPTSTACTGGTPYCLNAACVQCQPGATRCDPSAGGAYDTCSPAGAWSAATACGSAAGAVYSCANSGAAPTLAACSCSDPTTSCGTYQCGTVTNACGQVLPCGPNGDGSCNVGFHCVGHSCISNITTTKINTGCTKCGSLCC
jgi:hypothetical protein